MNETSKASAKDYYAFLVNGCGIIGVVLVILLYGACAAISLAPNYVLSQWVAESAVVQATTNTGPLRYGLAVTGFMVLMMTRAIFSFRLMLASSNKTYRKMVTSLLRAPILFYDTTPIGKILTRFAKDITVCDLMLNN